MSRVREFYPGVMIEFPSEADAPSPGSSNRVELSDGGGGPSTTTAKAIRVKQAALNRGMGEGDLALRLREGKAKLAIHDGSMFVRYDDLLELTRRGKVPKPTVSTADQEAAEAGDVERRTRAVAESIGVDIKPVSKVTEPAEPAPSTSPTDPVAARTAAVASAIGVPAESFESPSRKQEGKERDATTQNVTAGNRGRRTRIGRPLRWGERL